MNNNCVLSAVKGGAVFKAICTCNATR